MSEYVVVDKEKLEADLTIVADSIRAKSGTTEDLAFPLGMKEVVESIDTPKPEQEKSVTITKNGTTEVTPDEGKVLSKVTVTTNVESGGDPYEIVNSIINGTITEFVCYESGMGFPFNSNGEAYYPKIKKIITPNITVINCLRNCKALQIVDTSGTFFCAQVFLNCYELETLIIREDSKVCTLANNSNTFPGTKIINGTGYIYVPRTLIESYKTATNWVTLANQFRALEDYTVDGTITGALDESKI